jgi:uncharacterized protein (TIGR03086 family)
VIDVVDQHRQACQGFTRVVDRVGDRWAAPTPCTEWDARAVVEHVIGFHDVLLLRPLKAKPHRPKDDPVARWAITADALFDVLARPGIVDADRASLLGVLTTDVLVHTWDLARAIGDQIDLDPELCEIGYSRARANLDRLAASDMFASPVAVVEDAEAQDRLLAVLGRDPAWSAPA